MLAPRNPRPRYLLMAYLDRIEACNRCDPADYVPFRAAGRCVGWMRPDFVARLAAFPEVFAIGADGVALQRGLWTFEAASEALDGVVRTLVDEGVVPRYHGERYPVTPTNREAAVCTLDRAAAPHFGVRAFGQHLNGYVRRRDELLVWVARRARDKWNFPGRLDQMVAGGLPYELTLAENLVKECAEEASIPEELARESRPVGAVTYCQESAHGLKPDVIYTYDLELPADFTPATSIRGSPTTWRSSPACGGPRRCPQRRAESRSGGGRLGLLLGGDLGAHRIHVELLRLGDDVVKGLLGEHARLRHQDHLLADRHHGRDRADLEVVGQRLLLLGVDLGEDHVGVALGDLLVDRREAAAGAAPRRPEVDQHQVVVLDGLLERRVGQLHYGHVGSPAKGMYPSISVNANIFD